MREMVACLVSTKTTITVLSTLSKRFCVVFLNKKNDNAKWLAVKLHILFFMKLLIIIDFICKMEYIDAQKESCS